VGWACGTNVAEEKCTQNVVAGSERKEPLRRPKRRWEDDIKVGLKAVGWMGGCELD